MWHRRQLSVAISQVDLEYEHSSIWRLQIWEMLPHCISSVLVQTRIWICVRDMLIIIYNNMQHLYTSFLIWDIMTYNRTCHGIELIHWFIHTPALRFELYLVQLPHPSGSNLDVSISGITRQCLKWFSDGIVCTFLRSILGFVRTKALTYSA